MKRPPAPFSQNPVSDDDQHLFRASVGDVRKLPSRLATPDPNQPRPELPPQPPREIPEDSSSWRENVILQAGDIVRFRAAGVQERILRKLRHGDLRPEAELDLHGLTGKLALVTLPPFVSGAYAEGCRNLLVIHGKGYRSEQGEPKLKNLVCDWLANCRLVLAFCSARPEDGGTGAVYVRLKANPGLLDE